MDGQQKMKIALVIDKTLLPNYELMQVNSLVLCFDIYNLKCRFMVF